MVLSNNKDAQYVLNSCFPSVVSSFNILQYEDPSVNVILFEDQLLKVNSKFNNSPSIVAIKDENLDKQISFECIQNQKPKW